MSTARWRFARAAAVLAVLAASLASCGHTAAPGTGGTPSNSAAQSSPAATSGSPGTPTPSAASTSPSSQSRASAADQLARFFAAAEAADGALRHAAGLVNEGIGKTSIDLSPAALAAVKTLDVTAAASAIPAGLPPELLRQTLLVYSDLESRTIPLVRLGEHSSEYPMPLASQEGKDLYGCLGNGAVAAARFGSDLARLRALALATEPVRVAAPDSRAAAELALRILSINKRNMGCGSCGGWIATTLSQVVWQQKDEPGIGHSDGTIDGVRFRVVYHPGRGWDATTWAC
jgi:hypothetical protein